MGMVGGLRGSFVVIRERNALAAVVLINQGFNGLKHGDEAAYYPPLGDVGDNVPNSRHWWGFERFQGVCLRFALTPCLLQGF